MPPAGRVATVGQGNSPEEWFKSLPGVSKVLIVSIIGSTLLVMVGVVSPYSLALLWDPLWNKFEAWRLFTSAVFLGTPSFPFLMNLLIFVQYSIRYEKDAFDTGGGGGSADYAWMLVFGTTVLSILSIAFFNVPFLAVPLMFMVIYVWSRKVSWCSNGLSILLAY
jgi:Derlin-2/3